MNAYALVRDRIADVTGYTGYERGGHLATRCPAHEDQQASLSLSAKPDRVLVHCFAGCRTDDILNALDLRRRDLFDQTGRPWRRPWTPVKPKPVVDPGWTYVTELPDAPDLYKLAIYNAATAHDDKGWHPGGPVPPW